MPHTYTVFNRRNNKEFEFSMPTLDCHCSPTEQMATCRGEWIKFDAVLVYRHLLFDPRLPTTIPGMPWRAGVTVLYPWDVQPYTFTYYDDDGKVVPPEPVKPAEEYGNKSDYETKENPFGWFEHTKPQLALNIHYWTPARFGITQPIFLGEW
jgi:hypothetical protein